MKHILVAAVLLAGCKREPPGPTPEQVAAADQQAIAGARAAAMKFGTTLRARLTLALAAPGAPRSAIEVCATEEARLRRATGGGRRPEHMAEAQPMGAEVARTTGARAGRASLRLRNPRNAASDWVKTWLDEQGERAAAGVKTYAAVVDTPQGRVARVINPIAVEDLCTACHGAPESLDAGVREVLAAKYPEDRAVGYRAGDLRGALWAEGPAR
jgi:hypothetical protein